VKITVSKYPVFTKRWDMTQAHRVLKESGAMFVFSGWNNLKDMLVAADALGFSR
jgi:site-specific DNA-methyltransferase (adenine-specific)